SSTHSSFESESEEGGFGIISEIIIPLQLETACTCNDSIQKNEAKNPQNKNKPTDKYLYILNISVLIINIFFLF
ncbi:MAG: hypothetical protein AAB632_01905, partial [Patescibacteria group bacterium]